MTRTAKRGISNAAATAACAVCLVAAAAIVMVPLLALAHGQAGQPLPFHAPVDRVSLAVTWDAAWVSDVALADVFSQQSQARTGHMAGIGPAGPLDVGSLLGVHVPADARRDACADFAADAARDSLDNVRSRRGQVVVARERSVAGPDHRMVMPPMRITHAGGHAAAIPAASAEWHGAITSTRLVRLVDAFGQRLPVEPTIRNQVHPTSLSAHHEFRALDADHLRDRAAQLRAAACASEPDSARGPRPSPEKWTPEVSDHIRCHSRGLFTYLRKCLISKGSAAPIF